MNILYVQEGLSNICSYTYYIILDKTFWTYSSKKPVNPLYVQKGLSHFHHTLTIYTKGPVFMNIMYKLFEAFPFRRPSPGRSEQSGSWKSGPCINRKLFLCNSPGHKRPGHTRLGHKRSGHKRPGHKRLLTTGEEGGKRGWWQEEEDYGVHH